MRLSPFVLAAGLLVAAGTAHASLQPQIPVVEFYNVHLGHYFMTADADEIQSVEAGKAGPGWVRTGFTMGACMGQALCLASQAAVRRFYGTPGLGPNSHFYTADASEAAGLDHPGTGWSFEKIAFYVNLPDAAGNCPTGSRPVYRLYNMRAALNDSNHRYVTSAAERARMVSKGWADEGVRWCTDFAEEVPIKRFALEDNLVEGHIRPSAQCEDESLNLGACVAVNNLPPPTSLLATFNLPQQDNDFFDRTGFRSRYVSVLDASQGGNAARGPFIQLGAPYPYWLGIHVETSVRGPNDGTSINPLYQFATRAQPGQQDPRFFPFGNYESEVQLQVSFSLFVKTIQVRSAGGSAFGHPTLELVDQQSGKRVYFTTLAYGTVDAVPVYIALDSSTRRPIVGTSFRADSPYTRTFGLPSLPTPSGFASPNYWGWGGDFEYRMDRTEFKRVIDSWRTLVPDLSSDPADYYFINFHFNNEIGGDGEIGIWLKDYQLRLIRR